MLLCDLGITFVLLVPRFCDSLSSIHITRNLVFRERTKHIELDYHFIRSKLAEGLITLSHTSSVSRLADVFTKALSGPARHLHIRKFGFLSPSNLRGVVEVIDLG